MVYSVHKQAHNQNTENKDLSLSSKRGHIKYGAWRDIFGCASNGMAETILEMTWSDFGSIGDCLAHEMTS